LSAAGFELAFLLVYAILLHASFVDFVYLFCLLTQEMKKDGELLEDGEVNEENSRPCMSFNVYLVLSV
jgi:hypothetical protein